MYDSEWLRSLSDLIQQNNQNRDKMQSHHMKRWGTFVVGPTLKKKIQHIMYVHHLQG